MEWQTHAQDASPGPALRDAGRRHCSSIAGIIGFFYSASFGSPGKVDDVFGLLAVNGWHNIVHILTGGARPAASPATRPAEYALWLGIVYLAIAIWGFIIGSGESILGFIPVNTEDNFLHLILGAARRRRRRSPTPRRGTSSRRQGAGAD